MWKILIIILIVFLCFLYWLTTYKFSYWKKKNVPHLKPTPLFGNYGDFILLKTGVGNVTRSICKRFPREPYIGAYFGTEPTLLVQDPELLKIILTKDFVYFNGREASNYSEKEAATKGVFFNSGDNWKCIRQNLSPLFSTARTKKMFPLIEKCTYDLEQLIEYELRTSNVFEMNRLISRFTIDCVGSCAFGIEMNAMQKDYDDNPFKKIGDEIFGNSDYRGYLNIARSIWPWFFYAFRQKIYPRLVYDSMETLVANVCKLRHDKPSSRNDFVDMLLELSVHGYMVSDSMKNTTGEPKKVYMKLTNEIITSMCLAFFGGGFETSATTLMLTLFEIAKNQEIQLKAQHEVDEYLLKHNDKIGYDCITELPFVGACMSETLRLYPVFTVITREVMADYTLPTGLKLDKGVRIHVPVYSMHLNPENFPDPESYRPERFMPEEKHNIKPYTYFPFGEGARACIGINVAKVEVIAGLITILRNYKLKLAEGMASTVDFDPRILVSHTIGGVYLEFEKRRN